MPEQTPKLTGSYLKNAWAKKDDDGDYWLFIHSSEGRAIFCLSECIDLNEPENEFIRRALDAWLAEQDGTNGTQNGECRSL
jgi:hypothetical protein